MSSPCRDMRRSGAAKGYLVVRTSGNGQNAHRARGGPAVGLPGLRHQRTRSHFQVLRRKRSQGNNAVDPRPSRAACRLSRQSNAQTIRYATCLRRRQRTPPRWCSSMRLTRSPASEQTYPLFASPPPHCAAPRELNIITLRSASAQASSEMENRVVATLLTVMGGMESNDRVVVIGATNRCEPRVFGGGGSATTLLTLASPRVCGGPGPIRWTRRYDDRDGSTGKSKSVRFRSSSRETGAGRHGRLDD
jgi:hypothetical protein